MYNRCNDSATIPVDQTDFKRLVLEGTNVTFDQLPSKDQDLHFSSLESAMHGGNSLFTRLIGWLRLMGVGRVGMRQGGGRAAAGRRRAPMQESLRDAIIEPLA